MSFDLPPGPPPSTTFAPVPVPAPATTAAPNQQPGVPTVPGAAWKPVTGGAEMQSGEKLLVEAYAAIWLVLFVMVLLAWSRQKRIEDRIVALEDAIKDARDRGAYR